MNADEAKKLHLPAIIEAAGGRRDEAKSRNGDEWFFSPFREEQTASFKAAQGRNGNWMWTDYGTGKGGNVIAFANVLLGREPDDRAISDALKWLRGFRFETVAAPRSVTPSERPAPPKRSTPTYRITKKNPLKHKRNFEYIKGRGINTATAARYLEEITFQDDERQKVFYGLGMRNEADGFEITTATAQPFKTCIGQKSFTLVESPEAGPVHFFEGMFDYLSFLTLYGIEQPRGSAYILHSVAMTQKALEHAQRAASGHPAILWLDNDAAGFKAAEALFAGLGDHVGGVGTMNHLYEGHKDLNDWLAATRPRTIKEAQPKAYTDSAWNHVTPTRKIPE